MTILSDRIASPGEIAEEIQEPLNNVTYHINVLLKLGCIELVGVEPSRGGRVVRHLYRATQHALLDAEAWDQLDETQKLEVVTTLMRMASKEVNEAMVRGTFLEPDDGHLSRTPIAVDRAGWEEATAILDKALEDLMKIPEEVAARARRGEPEAEAMPIKIVMLQFRSPSPKTQ